MLTDFYSFYIILIVFLWFVYLRSTGDNNTNDNVCGAVIMARVHPVHLMNADWVPDGRQPSKEASRLGMWVCQ